MFSSLLNAKAEHLPFSVKKKKKKRLAYFPSKAFLVTKAIHGYA
jgi:hypothetical protein